MKTPFAPRFLSVVLLATAVATTACAVGGEEDELVNESSATITGRPYFQVWKSPRDEFYFHLRAANHETILHSQSYTTRTNALKGVLAVLDNAGRMDRYDVLQAQNGQWYFNLKAANGEVIGTSELYVSRYNALRGVTTVYNNVGDYLAWLATRTGARFEVFEGSDGRFFFRLRAKNGEIVLQSQGYTTEAAALNGTFSVADNGTNPARYDLRQSSNGGFYYNLKAANGEIIATSEVYDSKYNAGRSRDAVIALLPTIELL